jgi:hypothetical protein
MIQLGLAAFTLALWRGGMFMGFQGHDVLQLWQSFG